MALTKFGHEVRSMRRNVGVTLSKMAEDLDTSPAFLSAIETGRNKIPHKWVEELYSYFSSKGESISIGKFRALADQSNQTVSLDGLAPQHRALLAGFAHSDLEQEQLAAIGKILEEAWEKNSNENS